MSNHVMHAALNRSIPVPNEASIGLERIAMMQAHNRLLRLCLAGTLLVIVAMGAVIVRLSDDWSAKRPIVVRIDDKGDAVAAPFETLAYKPREPELRYFLMRFTVEHYGRMRATAADAFKRQLYFLERAQAQAVLEEEHRTKSLHNFLAGGEDEVEIAVTNVAIEDLRQAPYKASVDFEKIFTVRGEEKRREKYKAHIVFSLLETIPNNFVSVNPLGLVVSYFREYQALERQ